MELYGQKSSSFPQKIIIQVLEMSFIYLGYSILFEKGGNYIQETFGVHNAEYSGTRRIIIFTFILITFFRLGFMMFYLLKRKIPWEESISIPIAFALYYIGFPVLALPTKKPVDFIDCLGVVVFLAGSFINTYGEILRNDWKENLKNKGKLYTTGFFAYSRHINYFGDLLWVSGFAILTRNPYSLSIVLFLFSFFAFYNIPKLDTYLKSKYGIEFEKYAKKTAGFIPFIY